MRFFLLLLLSFSLSLANVDENGTLALHSELNTTDDTDTEPSVLAEPVAEKIQAKLLYQSYFELPQKLFKGQVFTLTIKALSAQEDYDGINYDFSNSIGLKLLTKEPEHKLVPPYFYDTFYFQVTGNWVKTPDVTTSLLYQDMEKKLQEELSGVKIETVRLNPDKDFSSVLAEKFKILEYKTTQYDNQHNIVVFSAEAKMANLKDFSLKAASKEGIDAYEEELPYANFTYYAVVSKQLNELKFSYFDIQSRRFKDVVIPIIVENDRVSTQTDLAPTQNTHAFKKMVLAGAVSILGLILYILRRNKLYLLIFIAPLFFIARLSVPTKHVCIQEDSNIYLLPMKNGTIFEQVPYRFTTEALGTSQDFTKIRMKNKQIGWVRDEDLCQD